MQRMLAPCLAVTLLQNCIFAVEEHYLVCIRKALQLVVRVLRVIAENRFAAVDNERYPFDSVLAVHTQLYVLPQ